LVLASATVANKNLELLEHAVRRSLLAFVFALTWHLCVAASNVVVQSFALPDGGGSPHDVAVGADGIVWYTAQRDGKLGRLDPTTGQIDLIPLAAGAAPHGVIIGPDGAPWITEGGTNAIVRVDPRTRQGMSLATLPRPWHTNNRAIERKLRCCSRISSGF
jgi:streptogramin lyase